MLFGDISTRILHQGDFYLLSLARTSWHIILLPLCLIWQTSNKIKLHFVLYQSKDLFSIIVKFQLMPIAMTTCSNFVVSIGIISRISWVSCQIWIACRAFLMPNRTYGRKVTGSFPLCLKCWFQFPLIWNVKLFLMSKLIQKLGNFLE